MMHLGMEKRMHLHEFVANELTEDLTLLLNDPLKARALFYISSPLIYLLMNFGMLLYASMASSDFFKSSMSSFVETQV
jgi:hypothetical protein